MKVQEIIDVQKFSQFLQHKFCQIFIENKSRMPGVTHYNDIDSTPIENTYDFLYNSITSVFQVQDFQSGEPKESPLDGCINVNKLTNPQKVDISRFLAAALNTLYKENLENVITFDAEEFCILTKKLLNNAFIVAKVDS